MPSGSAVQGEAVSGPRPTPTRRVSLGEFQTSDGRTMRGALQLEREHRDFAFLDLPFLICGAIAIRQLTLRQLLTRLNIDCPFLAGRTPEPEDIAEFLWYISTSFVPAHAPDHAHAQSAFIRQVAQLPYVDAVQSIHRYLDQIFLDAPGESGSKKAPIASIAATLIDIFGCEYGWTRETVLDSPMPQLYQLLREIELRHKGKDAALINRLSDKLKADWQNSAAPHDSTVQPFNDSTAPEALT